MEAMFFNMRECPDGSCDKDTLCTFWSQSDQQFHSYSQYHGFFLVLQPDHRLTSYIKLIKFGEDLNSFKSYSCLCKTGHAYFNVPSHAVAISSWKFNAPPHNKCWQWDPLDTFGSGLVPIGFKIKKNLKKQELVCKSRFYTKNPRFERNFIGGNEIGDIRLVWDKDSNECTTNGLGVMTFNIFWAL